MKAMTETQARLMLGTAIKKADCLFGGGMNWTPRHGPRVLLGGADPIELTVDQLEALAWWMRNKANESGV